MDRLAKSAFLSADLDEKIKQSKRLIMEWYAQFKGQVYVSFSGGKDSTVLLHIVRSLYPDVKAVFIDTGLEYPDIRNFAKNNENVEIIRPTINFKQVIEKYGYPIISKEQSQYIDEYRNTKSEKLKNTRWNGNKDGRGKISEKWKFLVDADFKISDKCCDFLKKKPAIEFEKKTGLKPFIGKMAGESSQRAVAYYKGECNAFKKKRPQSNPIMFWNDQDIWDYIHRFNVPYCKIYDLGFNRTGCMFCGFGCHVNGKFDLMKEHYPKIHDYCMNNLGLGKILESIKKGVIDEIN